MAAGAYTNTDSFQPGEVVAAYKASALPSPVPSGSPGNLTPEDTDTVSSVSVAAFSGLAAEKHFVTQQPLVAVQTLTVDATSGNFRLRAGSDTTPPLKYNITAANLKAAINLLPAFADNQVATVTGGPGDSGGTTPYVITFTALAAVAALEVLSGVAGQASTALVNVAGGGASATVVRTVVGTAGGQKYVGFLPDVV